MRWSTRFNERSAARAANASLKGTSVSERPEDARRRPAAFLGLGPGELMSWPLAGAPRDIGVVGGRTVRQRVYRLPISRRGDGCDHSALGGCLIEGVSGSRGTPVGTPHGDQASAVKMSTARVT